MQTRFIRGGVVLTFLLLLQAIPAASATGQATRLGRIEGTVLDSVTSLPIVGARVRLVELHREDITHEDGTFDHSDLRPSTYTIQVQRLGYRLASRRVTLQGGDTVRLNIVMAPAAITLTPTVVTGTLSERGGEQVLSPTATLAGAELDRNLAGTVAATVAAQPGVSLTSTGPATARPIIRGLGGDRILMLEDGQRPGDMSALSGDHAVAIDVSTARQIDVVRGPMSLLYGSSALGGVVNVVREEVPASRPEHMHATLTAQGASNGSAAGLSGDLTLPAGPFSLRGEGSYRDARDIRTPLGRLANTQSSTTSAAVGAARSADWGHAGLAYRFFANEYGVPGEEEGVTIDMRRHVVRSEAELHLDKGPFSTARLSAALTDYGHKELEESGEVGTQFDQTQFAADVLLRHDAVGVFAQGAFGGRVQLREISTAGELQTPSTDDYTVAGFVVEELGRGSVRVQTGARFDIAKFTPREQTFIDIGGELIPTRPRTFASLSGSLGVLYEPLRDLRFGASLSRAYRTPDFNELYTNGPHLAASTFEVGDPELADEHGLGLDIFGRFARSNVSAEFAVFGNRLTNYIFPSSRGRVQAGPQAGSTLLQFSNEDAEFRGFEGKVEWSVLPHLVLHGTISHVQAEFTSARDSIAIFANGDTTIVAASDFPPLVPPMHGEIGLRFDKTKWFAAMSARMSDRQDRLGDFEDPTS
ncbi:MAG: TonB-dependent receptor, partial [Gemmatimonadota bacterium]